MKRLFFSVLFSVSMITGFAQVGIGTTTPNASSVLDLTSTSKAFIPPRMNTTQRNQIANPTAGMIIYNTDSTCLDMYQGASGWLNLCNVVLPLYTGNVITYNPVQVSKNNVQQKIFVHLLPWFETPASSGSWGLHWTMANENPNTILANGNRQIASYYYPLTGPYASGDTALIDYQLLLMKLSGIDGVMIDWPGTGNDNGLEPTLPSAFTDANVLISRIGKVGLKYALVYEDNDLRNVGSANSSAQISAAQADLSYAQTHYFTDPNYQQVNGTPMLLDFGPQQFTVASSWTSVLAVLSPKPSLFSIMFNNDAGSNAVGQFGWVEQNGTAALSSFYSSNSGIKISAAYPGFNSFYVAGGWGNPTPFTLPYSASGTSTFQTTLTQALQSGIPYLQVATWNDYGEGTMIEPTDSVHGGFGYSYLTTLQTQLGVSSLSQSDLAAVFKLYQLRQTYVGNTAKLNQLNQVYYYMVSLQMDKAKQLMVGL